MEQFEARVLLSITPPASLDQLESTVCAMDQYTYLDTDLAWSVYHASDLASYDQTQLQTTYQWVVGVDNQAGAPALAASLGADFLAYSPYLQNATIWEFSETTSWLSVAYALQQADGVDYFYPLVPREVQLYAVPNDPLFPDQWHLQNTGQSGGTPGVDANVVLAWDSVTGSGVVIGIVDDSLEYDHPDLLANYRADLSYDFWEGDPDPSPSPSAIYGDNHGTAVGGVAAAVGNNGVGVSGSAPGAQLAGIRLTSGWPTNWQVAQAFGWKNDQIDIYNNSWGWKEFLRPEDPQVLAAVKQGVTSGRDGLGCIYLFAAGNERLEGCNTNYYPLQSSRFGITVAAIDHDGRYAYYSNPGASVFISGESNSFDCSITTTDRTGADGYNEAGSADGDSLGDVDYTSTFGGTSSATPLLSGVVALILEANPALTYRDVQYVLANTARRNDPTDYDWVQNGAGYWLNNNYGFGAVDAAAAVQLASQWVNVGPEYSTQSDEVEVGEDIPDGSTIGVTSTLTLDDAIDSIEWVEVTVDITHDHPGDLEIVLISPDGTESRLTEATSMTWSFSGTFEHWTLSSCHYWGESSEGEWTLVVRDVLGMDVGTFNSWSLTAYGTSESGGPEPPGPSAEAVGPELISISPNEGGTIQTGSVLHIAPRELRLLFNENQQIDPATLGAIHIVRSGGDDVLGNANDVTIENIWVGIGDRPNEVIVRFAETLPDDLYQITIVGDGSKGDVVLKNIEHVVFHKGEDLSIAFSLDLGAQVISVVPQPTYRDAAGNLQQSRNTIDVYFNDDQLDADSARNTQFYQLFVTQETATPDDDVTHYPVSVDYDPVENKAVLTFANDLATFGAGAFRLRIGNQYQKITTPTAIPKGIVGDTFATASDVGTLADGTAGKSVIISSAIEALPYDLQWPGSIDEIGHRDALPSTIAVEQHLGSTAADDQYGAATIYYNFKNIYGALPNGSPATNLITPEQKQRVREIFELYSRYLGVQFIEDTRTTSDAQGLTIATGDLRVLDPAIPTGPGGVTGLAGGGLAIMDQAEAWQDGYGQSWMGTAMHEIGHLLGLGHTYDMPAFTIMGTGGDEAYNAVSAEDIYPGNVDIIHGQHVFRPDGNDVDLYKFTLVRAGTFSAEVTAERLGDASLLDSVLTVYDATGAVIARNDDYYSSDSYVELTLPAGDYYVAVTSSGNTQFDADVAASGLGGLTQGDYALRLTYQPSEDGTGNVHMVDATGTPLDGDADGVPGGVYDFWFDVQTQNNTLFVYKYETADVAAGKIAINSSAPLGSLANPYRYVKDALAAATPGKIVRILGNRDRTFDAQRVYDVAVDPTATAVGDFAGDGVMDIVATNEDADSVSVLFGLGDGTYWANVNYDVGDRPGAVTLGDLDNDGDLDIVVTNRGSSTVTLLFNNGSGTFGSPVSRFTGASPSDVALGDVNGDKWLDIIVANRADNSVGVLRRLAAGGYADQVSYSVGLAPAALDVGDLNNDGLLDVVVVNQTDGTACVLLGQQDGTFKEVSEEVAPGVFVPVRPSVGASPSGVAIADLDGDGYRDFAVSNAGGNTISVLLGLGNGKFQPQVTYATGSAPSSIAVADIDLDGALDIVTANKNSDNVSVFFGHLYYDPVAEASVFEYQPAVNYVVGDQPVGVALADLDGDSRPDIVTANFGSAFSDGDAVSVLLARRDEAYLIGLDRYNNPLEDGPRMEIPKGVTVMIDAGAVFKLSSANVDVGSATLNVDRSEGALSVLGTPRQDVYFTSYYDKSLGSWTSDILPSNYDIAAQGGQWGGLVFRNEQDYDSGRKVLETEGVFLNYVNHAEIRYGGGQVTVSGVKSVYDPIHTVEARPTISYNTILYSADAAISADPNSFADTKFQGSEPGKEYTADYDRVGPDIHGNTVLSNSINALFVRIETQAGRALDELEVCARFDDTDIVHVIAENLVIAGAPGGATYDGNHDDTLAARLDARLTIDPGAIVKLSGSRIETEVSAQLLAEGTRAYPIIFTSLADDTYGAGGTFDTGNNASLTVAQPRDWGGIYFGPASSGSIDHAYIAYGGGQTRVEGGFAYFDAVEIHQADVRLANSVLANNSGFNLDDPMANTGLRAGRPSVTPAVIFVRESQPILVGNVIRDNEVPAISINANSLVATQQGDPGRSTGQLDAREEYPDNSGPLVRDNHLSNNDINGMIVRGEILTIDCIWDDTDIVHVVYDEIIVPNFHTYGGLRLQSSQTESLVVKFSGANAGITAVGTTQEIDDRIGGTLQIIGVAGHPVVLTSLADDTVGAGLDPWGATQKDTDNAQRQPAAGDWRSIKLEEYVNDRNVEVVNEAEAAYGEGQANNDPLHAQPLGELATSEKNGDDNLRLGFDVHGFIRSDNSDDADVYSFAGRGGTEVWIDIDRTSLGLDSVVELIDADGNVLARSDNSPEEEANLAEPFGIALTMDRDVWDAYGDMYTTNVHDAGMRLVLPGAVGTLQTYYVRVRSADVDGDSAGDSSGGYQLQIRLREEQEIAGSAIRNSSIRYATNGIELLGLPTSSPLTCETAEIEAAREEGVGAFATALVRVPGDRNDFIVTATQTGTDFNDVWIVFVDGGFTGNGAVTQYNSAFNNGGTIIRVLITYVDPENTTAATAVAAINAEGTFSAVLTTADGGANNGSGLLSPMNTQLALTAGGVDGTIPPPRNDTFEDAEYLGNLLDTNYGTIEVSGYLTTQGDTYDIDWYSFQLDPQKIQSIEGVGSPNVWSLTFDIDYADGMGRPDASIYVFDSTGKLIFTSENSNVADDQLDSLAALGMEDLARGSAGPGDPYIGPVALMDGDGMTYYVAVASRARFADALAIYEESQVPLQPLLRREPVNSITRVAEDNVGDTDGDMIGDTNASGLSGSPESILFPDPTSTELSLHIADYHLNDVVMYVCVGTDVYTFNPFTGEYQVDLTGSDSRAHVPDTQVLLQGATGRTRYDDIVMRDDGKLYTLTSYLGTGTNNVGRFRQISTADGTTVYDVDDGIETYVVDPTDPTAVIPDDLGVSFHAMIDVVEHGDRFTYAIGGSDPANQMMFKFDQDGNVVSVGGDEEALPTNVLPWRMITNAAGFITGLDFCDGTLYGITDAGILYALEGYDSAPEDAEVPDGDPPTWTAGNWIIDLSDPSVLSYDLNAEFGLPAIAFSGLSIGPANVEDGAYAETFFATDNAGGFYAFQKDGDAFHPAPVFIDGLSMITLGVTDPMMGVSVPIPGATGVAFSTLDYNLWHITTSRYDDAGHTINVGPDDSRPERLGYPADGDYSYWFGLERSSTFQHPDTRNYLDDNAGVLSTYDLPGGAHGVLTTDTFSLAGYSSADNPILTFEYFLDTDGTDTNIVTDSARVYISADGVTWTLLASNIDTPLNVMSTSDDRSPPPVKLLESTDVFEFHEDASGWLQARIGLGSFVGYDNLRLKFEFTTAGSTNVSDVDNLYTGAYLRAVAGSELIDGDAFTILSDASLMGQPQLFEFDMGWWLQMPNSAGSAIDDGETLTITDDLGNTVTFEFDKDGNVTAGNTSISISDLDSSHEVAVAIGAAFDTFYGDAVSIVVEDRVYLCSIEKDLSGLPVDPLTWHGALSVTASAGIADMLQGNAPGTVNDPDGAVLVPVDAAMGAAQVAYQISSVLDTHYAGYFGGTTDGTLENPGIFTSVKCDQDLIYLLKHVCADAGPLAYYNALSGETPAAGREGANGTQFYFNTQFQDNAHEGWYIDNVMIGFAERGEMITAAEPNTSFGTLDQDDIAGMQIVTEGYYHLEIRLATEYSVWTAMFGTVSTRSFDTNDRQNEDITIVASPSYDLVHLSTFTVSDSLPTQTFRFVDTSQMTLPVPGIIDIYFSAGRRADQMAQAIVSAINSATTLNVTASAVRISGRIGSERVVLNGATAVTGIETLTYDNEGEFPTDVEAFDVDGDGMVDLLFATSEYTDMVTDLLGGTQYEVGDRPSALELADFNGDGLIDIVTANAGSHNVSVLLGNVGGSFEGQKVYDVGMEPSNVEVFDLNGDTYIDIITTNKTDGTITILYGNGDGTFGGRVDLSSGWAPMSAAAGLLNSDAFGDIVVANSRDNTVAVFLSKPDGTYNAPAVYPVGRLPLDVELADMDNDLVLEILTANRVDGTVSVLIGNGDGTFRDAKHYYAGTEPVDLELSDLNGDANLDVVTCSYSANVVYTLYGTGSAVYTLMDGSPRSYSVGEGPRGLALGDLDGDLVAEFITADYVSHNVYYLLSTFNWQQGGSIGLGAPKLRNVIGDNNAERQQGQILISANEILYSAEYGIKFDAGDRDPWPHASSTAALVQVNEGKLVPCVTIENNLVVASGAGGILFSGDPNTANDGDCAQAAVPFGRILNNTVYGGLAPVRLLEPGEVVLASTDDGSTAEMPLDVALGFTLNFYGTAYTTMYVNTNGNVTFGAASGDVDPDGFPYSLPMIAPFWSDVDTRASGEVRVAYGTSASGNLVVQVDWINVGYSSSHNDKKNSFTLYIEDDPDGDIVSFVYHNMEWTTGDSDGSNGFGGEGAEIGFNSGNASDFVSVSRPNSLRDLEDLMRPGFYVWRLNLLTGEPMSGGGVGIEITENASPTVLNNIVANLDVGIAVDATCQSSVLGANVYQNNAQNTLGISPAVTDIALSPTEPLFVNAKNGNFYLKAGSRAIDGSIDSLEERPAMKEVRDPLGIGESPILAPDYDLFGQLRSDDPSAQSPPGVGSNVFKDRGAIDRVDFSAPMATIIDPMDNDPAGVDRNVVVNDVFVIDESIPVFAIQLTDTVGGIGIDDSSVRASTVQIFKNGSTTPLEWNVDYFFRYDERLDVISLIPATGLWEDGATYKIVLDNGADGICDVAGNPLRSNRLDNTTYFTVSIAYCDFGDAPDPDYATTLAHDGPRHLLMGSYYLGNGVTGEADANFAVDEDDNLLNDASGDAMDDGVSFTSALLLGDVVTFNVKASASGGYLHAWIDLNADGDFNDAAEHVIASQRLSRGWNALSFELPDDGEVPYSLHVGETFMRFRYIGYDDTAAPIGPTGEVIGGEVEDYMVTVVDTLKDYGDAPAPYPTLLADSGAVHELTNELHLGAVVDAELNGQPSATARGDDDHGLLDETGEEPVVIDDEDGVQFTHWLVPGYTVAATVTASAEGYLNAWIDFNADGDWNDAGEQIADGLLLSAGPNVVPFAIPADAVAGKTFARFRFSSQADLEPTGLAPDGEVEDYQILVTSQPRDYGDAPRTFSTKANSESATAHLVLSGRNNDMLLTAVVPGDDMNGVKIVIVNNHAYGNVAEVEFDATARKLVIDVDPQATTANTVVAAINSQVGSIFTAELSSLADRNNNGTGLLPMKGTVATTSGGEDGSGDAAAYHVLWTDSQSLEIDDALFLGAWVDAELDGQPDVQAEGDDLADSDDEDGVSLPSFLTAGTTRTVDVQVHLGDATEAYLYGWIDLNQDGLFSADEQVIYGDRITASGVYSVALVVPLAAMEGVTYARFRLSTDASLSFDGVAPDGEVEDYRVEIRRGTGVISGWVFEDDDRDGVFDKKEDGISGVIVYIDEIPNGATPKFDWEDLNGNAKFDPGVDRAYEPYVVTMEDDLTTFSEDETGKYVFDGLPGRPAPYTIRFDAGALTAWVTTYPDAGVHFPDGSHGNDDHSYTIYLEEAETRPEVNFGNYRKPSISVLDTAVVEGNSGFTNVQVTVRVTDSFGAPITLDYHTENGSATLADQDYVQKSGSITINPPATPVVPTWDTYVLTDNVSEDYDYGVSGDYVAWEGKGGDDWDIYLAKCNADGTSTIVQLTNNDTNDHFVSLCDTGTGINVVWVGSDGHDTEIYYYKGETDPFTHNPIVYQLTDNAYDDRDPQVSDSFVTWWADDGSGDGEIYVLDLAFATVPDPWTYVVNLTNNEQDARNPVVSGKNIAWVGQRGSDTKILAFNGEDGDLADPVILTVSDNNFGINGAPQIDGNQIVWEGRGDSIYDSDGEIFCYNFDSGATTRITNNYDEDRAPQISGNDVVWEGYSGWDFEVYYYNTIAQDVPENISMSGNHDESPQICGEQIVWRSWTGWTWDVLYRDLGGADAVTNISNSTAYDFIPQVSDSMVVWRSALGGDDFEIITAMRNEAELLQTITLRVVGDTKYEGDEDFRLVISTTNASVVITDDTGTIAILNDDGTLDFGDAPDPTYPTLLVNNGARHRIVPGVYLGASVDTETNGKPNATATGDDVVTSDDEDGVTFSTSLAQGMTVNASVTVSLRPTDPKGYLDAWIDFDGDGQWDDDNEEHILAGVEVHSGVNTLTFQVPSWAKLGNTFARFRLNTERPLSSVGQASNGEVEDYRVEIVERPSVNDHVIIVSGTDGDDLFEFFAGETLAVEINGARQEYPAFDETDPDSVHTILFDGGKGTDTVIFHGSEDDESVELWSNRGVFRGPEGDYDTPHSPHRYLVDTTNVELLTADAGGGDDKAVLHDSAGDDVFTSEISQDDPDHRRLGKMKMGVTVTLVATGYAELEAASTAGGTDAANFYGSPGFDQFDGDPASSSLSTSDGYLVTARGFDSVYAAGEGSDGIGDKATVRGSSGDDNLIFHPEMTEFSGSGYSFELESFRYVTARAVTGGTDRATLFDSAGNDTYTGRPEYIKLSGTTFDVTAYSFRYTATTANAGGIDTAQFYGSNGNDLFEASPTYARIEGDNFYNRVDRFENVTANGHEGTGGGNENDVVRLYGSSGDDVVKGSQNFMQLQGSTFNILAYFFNHLVAYANEGNDVAYFYGTPGDDVFEGTTIYGKMTSKAESRSLRAYGFDEVKSWGNGGLDRAYLHDSHLVDLLETGDPTPETNGHAWAELGNEDLDFRLWITDYDEVFAYSSGPAQDDKHETTNPVDFILQLNPDPTYWRDI